MSISKDLFLAILSLDSYNRGYGAGIDDGIGIDDGLGTSTSSKVGAATFKSDKGDADAQAADFYAISYTVKGGSVTGIDHDTTVISYRGTDHPASEYFGTDRPIHTGDYDELELSLASQFRKSVGASLATGTHITLTGHSLGGGLAGFTCRAANDNWIAERRAA